MIIPAWHLPGLDESSVGAWDERQAGDARLRCPRLTPADIAPIGRRLRDAQTRLRERSVDSIIDTIDRVAHRLLDPHDPLRATVQAALPPLTGYSPPMVSHILDGMAADWRRPALERLIEADLGGTDILERPVDRRGRHVIAMPWPVLLHVFAGNIPGVAVTSLVRALLVRAASFGKTAAGEPLLPALFARAIAEQDRTLGDALAVAYWKGGDHAIEEAAFNESDAIVVYGGGHTLADVRARAPAHLPVLDHGPRLSVGFVARDAFATGTAAPILAREVARSIATFDQQGCVSPHAVYIENPGAIRSDDAAATDAPASPKAGTAGTSNDVSAERFATLLVDAFGELEADLPRGAPTPDEAAAIRETRTRAEFGSIAGRPTRLVSSPDAPFTVVLHHGPGFEPSCLQRTIHVYVVPSIDDALSALQPHRALLQSAAIAGGDDTLVQRIAQSGFTRVTSFAHMAWPDAAGPHDGRGPLAELVRLVSVETP